VGLNSYEVPWPVNHGLGSEAIVTAYAGRIAKNTAFLLAGSIVAQILLAVQGIIIARSVGPVEYGYYATALAFVGFFGGLFILGLDSLMAREIARFPESAGLHIGSGAVTALLSSMLVLALMIALVQITGYSSVTRSLVIVVGLGQTIIGMTHFVRGIFRGFERMELDALVRVVQVSLGFASVCLGLYISGSIGVVAASLLAGNCIGFLIGVLLITRQEGVRDYRVQRGLCFSLVRAAVPIGLSQALITGYVRLDSLLLSLFRVETEVGFYMVAFTLAMAWMPIPLSLSQAMLPQLARSFQADKDQFALMCKTGIRYVLALGLPVAVVTSTMSVPILSLLYGKAYLGGASSLQVLGWSAVLIFPSTFLSTVLISIDKQDLLLRVVGVNMLTSLALGLVLIPLLGASGAAWVVVIREGVSLALQSYYVSNAVGRIALGSVLMPTLIAGGLLGLSLLLTSPYLGAWLAMGLGSVVYVVALLLTGGIRRDELQIVRRLFRRHQYVSDHSEGGE